MLTQEVYSVFTIHQIGYLQLSLFSVKFLGFLKKISSVLNHSFKTIIEILML